MNLVVSQAMATGLPVVTTAHSGLPEQVLDGVTGFVVQEGDYEALAERVLRIAEHPELLEAFGRAGRRHVEERYDAATAIEVQIQAYRDVAVGRIPPPGSG